MLRSFAYISISMSKLSLRSNIQIRFSVENYANSKPSYHSLTQVYGRTRNQRWSSHLSTGFKVAQMGYIYSTLLLIRIIASCPRPPYYPSPFTLTLQGRARTSGRSACSLSWPSVGRLSRQRTRWAFCLIYTITTCSTNSHQSLDASVKRRRNGVFCDDSRLRFFRIAPFWLMSWGATSPKEGISHTIAEELIKLKASPIKSGLPELTHLLAT